MSGQITNDFLDPSSTVTGTKRNKEDSVAVLPPKQAGSLGLHALAPEDHGSCS